MKIKYLAMTLSNMMKNAKSDLAKKKVIKGFVGFLSGKGMLKIWPQIAHMAENIMKTGIETVEIKSARNLSATMKKDILRYLESETGQKLKAEYIIDASILAGFHATGDSWEIDGSARSVLDK